MVELENGHQYYTFLKKKYLPFDLSKVKTFFGIPSIRNKPNNAFWGSPIDTEYGWKEWCEREDFEVGSYDWDNPIKWKLKDGSKVYRIYYTDVLSEETSGLTKYLVENPLFKSSGIFGKCLDFELMLEDGIVAVELMDGWIGHRFENFIEASFYTWDCESIVVLDETKIEILEG